MTEVEKKAREVATELAAYDDPGIEYEKGFTSAVKLITAAIRALAEKRPSEKAKAAPGRSPGRRDGVPGRGQFAGSPKYLR